MGSKVGSLVRISLKTISYPGSFQCSQDVTCSALLCPTRCGGLTPLDALLHLGKNLRIIVLPSFVFIMPFTFSVISKVSP